MNKTILLTLLAISWVAGAIGSIISDDKAWEFLLGGATWVLMIVVLFSTLSKVPGEKQ